MVLEGPLVQSVLICNVLFFFLLYRIPDVRSTYFLPGVSEVHNMVLAFVIECITKVTC